MSTKKLLSVGFVFVMAAAAAIVGRADADPRSLVGMAIANDPVKVERAIAALREMGPDGLEQALALRDEWLSSRGKTSIASPEIVAAELRQREPAFGRLEAAIDRIAGQRYATVSRLYWYTDLEKAKQAARASGKPILSLRMLGKLTDEFSCANSRFFRTTLYANQEIAKRLGERFVLHWKSVRPVPRVTIDLGDGRKLKRTLTGNSAHYALTADGTPLDVLPGLYGPRPFLAWIDDAEQLHAEVASVSGDERGRTLRSYHARRATKLDNDWQTDLAAIGGSEAKLPSDARHPAAFGDTLWQRIAQLARHQVELDFASRRIIRDENPAAARAGALSVTKRIVEDPILRLVRTLQETIAIDSVRNEYTLHRRIHDWFADGQIDGDAEALNERVYAELFLTPSSDPWLGLAPATYTALSNGGVVTAGPEGSD